MSTVLMNKDTDEIHDAEYALATSYVGKITLLRT